MPNLFDKVHFLSVLLVCMVLPLLSSLAHSKNYTSTSSRRIKFRFATLLSTYNLETGTLSYFTDLLHPCVPVWTLRSSNVANLHVPRTNLAFSSRSFHIVASTIWNALSPSICSSQTINSFWRHLKTHFFQSAFNSDKPSAFNSCI